MNNGFTIELSGGGEHWWRYNVVLMCELQDADGQRTGFVATEDTVAGAGAGLTARPDGTAAERTTTLTTEPCHAVRLYIYAIPHSLPADRSVGPATTFGVRLRVACGGKKLADEVIDINLWGGASEQRQYRAGEVKLR